jgi:hypothetical protein
MPRVTKPKQRPKKSKVPKARGIVDRHGNLEESELADFSAKYITQELEREMKLSKYKFEPGIQIVYGNDQDFPASDCPLDKVSEFLETYNLDHGLSRPPENYTGPWEPKTEGDQRAYLAALRAQNKQTIKDKDGHILAGNL